MKNINKSELVDAIAKHNDCTKKEAESAIEMFIGAVKNGLVKADKITLVGFGTCYKQKRKAGTGRNPRTGEAIKISASTLPKFKAGQGFKDAVNK